jgi:hypothetical protein
MRVVLVAACIVLVAFQAYASESVDRADPFRAMPGRMLTDGEMAEVTGSLRVFGVKLLERLGRVDRKQRTSDASKVHCDIIAQNRAESLGLNTSNQDGSYSDYNYVKVSQIYQSFPDNRTSTPTPGTAGYVFTAYGSDMQHLEAYSAVTVDSYTRYWNDSFAEYTATRDPSYLPPGATAQAFVALPGYRPDELYYR